MYKVTVFYHPYDACPGEPVKEKSLDYVDKKTEYLFNTKEEAFVFYESFRYGIFDWLGNGKEQLSYVFDEADGCYQVMLHKWDNFDDDVKVVYGVVGSDESFDTIEEAYSYACEIEGVEDDSKIDFFQKSLNVEGNSRSMYFELPGIMSTLLCDVLLKDKFDDKCKVLRKLDIRK